MDVGGLVAKASSKVLRRKLGGTSRNFLQSSLRISLDSLNWMVPQEGRLDGF
jgi:hypothetical protein